MESKYREPYATQPAKQLSLDNPPLKFDWQKNSGIFSKEEKPNEKYLFSLDDHPVHPIPDSADLRPEGCGWSCHADFHDSVCSAPGELCWHRHDGLLS